jgi:hypothetical protein
MHNIVHRVMEAPHEQIPEYRDMQTVYYAPILNDLYDLAANAMYEAGLSFDGTINQLEQWLKINKPELYVKSIVGVPASMYRSKKVLWIPYVA